MAASTAVFQWNASLNPAHSALLQEAALEKRRAGESRAVEHVALDGDVAAGDGGAAEPAKPAKRARRRQTQAAVEDAAPAGGAVGTTAAKPAKRTRRQRQQ